MKRYIFLAVLAIFVVILVSLSPFTIVGAGQRGVQVTFGHVDSDILQEGLHVVNPLSSIHKFSIQTQKVEVDASAASSDLQTVTARVAINYHLSPEVVGSLYQQVGDSSTYAATVVAPAIQDSVKAATAQYTAEQLITKRAEVSTAIQTNLSNRLTQYAVVESVAITNFEFSESFNQAIEAKVTAEQNALAAKNKLDQVQYEAQQTVATAQAEAESIRIKGEALKENSQLVQLEWVNKWNGVLPSTVMGDAIPMINLK